MPEGFEGDVYFNRNGVLTEHRWIGGIEVVVHYEDIPETDCTTVDGIPCTTALRTMIDVAVEVDRAQFERMVQDCLRRRLFTIEQASARLDEPDMQNRLGAELLRRLLFG